MAAALGIQGNVGGGGNAAFKVRTRLEMHVDNFLTLIRTRKSLWLSETPILWQPEPWPMPFELHLAREGWTK